MMLRSRVSLPILLRWLALGLVASSLLIFWRFHTDLDAARKRVSQGSVMIETRCGPIEYQEAGTGVPLLSVHGSGGGFDQGMAFAAPLATRGIRVIAMSRFGYLRTPMPPDSSAEAQADAHRCLLDALGIKQAAVLGGSAGAPSALQMAIRHPDRVSALILLVPLAYRPLTQVGSVSPLAPWVESTMMTVIGSDFLFWSALHVSRARMIATVLATPPEILGTASAKERVRINAMLDNILPVSARVAGLRSDTAAGKQLKPAALETIRAPTLIISARDDGYGTYASAQYTAGRIAGAKFIGFKDGGHSWVGHDDQVMAEIQKMLMFVDGRTMPRGVFALTLWVWWQSCVAMQIYLEPPMTDAELACDFEAFAKVVRTRRSVRAYLAEPIPDAVLDACFDLALLAPTSHNLETWQFIDVRNPEKLALLRHYCLDQPPAMQAPTLIVAVARPDFWPLGRRLMLEALAKENGVAPELVQKYRTFIPLIFEDGPFHILAPFKRLAFWGIGLFKPFWRVDVGRAGQELWATKTAALGCQNLMLALRASGFDSCAMEGFDEPRVKRLLGLPRAARVVMVIAAGRRADGGVMPQYRFDARHYIQRV